MPLFSDLPLLSLILAEVEATSGRHLFFWCPGCQETHNVRVGTGDARSWGWNGSVDKPTFQPSILVTHVGGKAEGRCHSFVEDGRIRFLPDCSHALAGQVAEIPQWPYQNDGFPATREVE